MQGPNNIYTTIVTNYSDSQLLKIIRNANEYSRAQVSACEVEVAKRSIGNINQTFIEEGSFRTYVLKVKNDIANNISIDDCKNYLNQEGLNKDQVNDIINKATRIPQPEIISPYKNKDHYGVPIGISLLILFSLLKIIKMLSE